jgi:alkanesulfonate monooxygenase SsuD/methylene tetrahydromethanopterin reductase-like flavin-dependent oxidoreductase (luciferase family)
MQVGISIHTTEIGNDPVAIRDFVQAAEDMGYEHLTLIDHVIQSGQPVADDWRSFYTRDNAFHEPLIFYAYVAALTKSIELATAILILPQRQTALVAKQCAELDLLSGGRLRLGVGIGWNEMEFDVLHENFRNRARRVGSGRMNWSILKASFIELPMLASIRYQCSDQYQYGSVHL